DARTLIAYFERNGAPKCPPTANPAEYILDVAGKPGARVDWPRVWRESNERQAVLAEIARINALKHRAGADRAEPGADRTYARSVAYQTRLVFARMLLMQWRNTEYQLTRIALQVICAVVVGLAYLRLGDGLADMSNKMMALFFVAVLGILATNNVMPQYLRDRRVYGRESSTNQYGWQAFGLSVVFAEWPFAVLANTLFVVILYWMVGLNPASDRVGYFYIVYIVFGFFSLSLGQMIASFSANEFIAALIAPIPGALLTLVAGATTPYPSMPKFFSSWLYWLSPHRYLLEGLIANDLHGARVHCNPDELYTFEPPANSTCRDYAGDWVKSAIGYIDNLDATSACKYCPYSVGDEFVSTFSWSYDNRWRNFGILFAFIAFNIIFTIAMVRIYKVNKR
ncbi:ATP-binding cassette transporter snq2, partial [Coemansia sp. Cherry 401B]